MGLSSENQGVGRVNPEPEDVDLGEIEGGEQENAEPAETESSSSGEGGNSGGGNFIVRAAGAIGSGFTTAIGKIAGWMGLPKGATSAILAVIAACAVGGGAIGITNNNYNEILVRQDAIIADDCLTDVEDAKNAVGSSSDSIDASEEEMENAKKLWAYCIAMGMTDEQAAGVLGNMTQEGSLDPTTVEQYYMYCSERYTIGPWKASILGSDPMYDDIPGTAMDNFCITCIQTSNLSLYHFDQDGVSGYCCGLGLIGWTAGGGYDLVSIARALNEQGVKDSEGNPIVWYSFEYQVAALGSLNEAWNTRFNKFLQTEEYGQSYNENSVEDSSMAWLSFMERGNPEYTDYRPGMGHDDGKSDRFEWEERETFAKQWYEEFHPQSAAIAAEYSDFADNAMALSEQMGFEAANIYAKEVEEDCPEEDEQQQYDNGDLARAFLSFAWDDMATAQSSNGTELYVELHELFFPGDGYFKDCGRGVATAVHWANADDDYPSGPTGDQDVYLATHPDKWEKVGDWSNMSIDDLEPGDIFITTGARRGSLYGHTFMYVSNEIIQEKYPDNNQSFISASKDQYSPCTVDENSGWKSQGYYVYRYVGDYDGTDADRYTGNASGDS